MTLSNRKGCTCVFDGRGNAKRPDPDCPAHGRYFDSDRQFEDRGGGDQEDVDRQSDWIRDLPSHEQHEHW